MTQKISIITATMNSEETLQNALDSVSSQTYTNVEHIVIDGKSTDGTLEILERGNHRVSKWISEPDSGIYDALNKGIKLCNGDIVGFLHADDEFANANTIEKIAQLFENPEISAVYGNLDYIDKNDPTRIVRKWRSKQHNALDIRLGWMPAHPTLYVRKEWYQRTNYFDTRFRISGDYDSILKLFTDSSFLAVYHDELIVRMRIGGASNRSLKALRRKTYEDWDAIRSAGFDYTSSILALGIKNFSKVGQFFK